MSDNTSNNQGIFSRLNRLFSTDIVIRNVGGKQLKTFDFDKVQAYGNIKTNSLVDRFTKLHRYGANMPTNPVMNYQTLRTQLYTDYEAMDTESIIASALDILADESTLKNENKEVIQIKSPDENIQKILYNLFYDVLNIEFNLWMWTRNMCKYGDFFLHLSIAEKFGVYNVTPLSVYDVIREEGQDPEHPNKITFNIDPSAMAMGGYNPVSNKQSKDGKITFENYEVAHFRLLSDANYLPLGRSFIEPARKTYKQYCLDGDTKVWTPDGYKKIKNIVKGDVVISFNKDTKQYENTHVSNSLMTGIRKVYELKTPHRSIVLTNDHPILTESGDYKNISEIDIHNDKIATFEGEYVDGGNNNVLYEYIENIEELDSREVYDIEVESDNHNFIAGGIVVHNCLMKDAMMLHRIARAPEKRVFKINVGNLPPNEVDGYMQKLMQKTKKTPYIDPQSGQYNLKYNMMNMMEDYYIPVRNNDSSTDIQTLKGLEYNAIEDVNFLRDEMLAALKIPKAFFGFEKDLCIAPDTKIPLLDGRGLTAAEIIEEYNNGKTNYVYSLDENTKNIVPGEIKWAGYTRMNTQTIKVWLDNGEFIQCTPDHNFLTREGEWKEAQHLAEGELLYNTGEQLYKVSKIEYIEELIDTCDLTIKTYHNFTVSPGIIIHNSGKATLAAEDIRFARTVERIQRIILSELYKIALIHLYVQGYDGDSLSNFELGLTTPSIIFEQEKVALWKEKVTLAKDIIDSKLLPTDWIYHNIFELSEDQYDDYRDMVLEDMRRNFRMSQVEMEGNDPAKSGKSYGTPHDLASLYGKGRYGGTGAVPPGYDETRPVGRPIEKASHINTQEDPLGKDRIGKKENGQLHNPKAADEGDGSPKKRNLGGLSLKEQNLLESISFDKETIFDEEANVGLLDETKIKNDLDDQV